jgi:tetratricopeptide (TPR) repeat protein
VVEAPNDLYERILAAGPSSGTLLVILSDLKKQGQLNKVIRECIRALNAFPDDVRIRRTLAETYYEAGLIGQAEDQLREVVKTLEELSSVYRLQAEIYRRVERKSEAAEALRVYLAHRPDDLEALALLNRLISEEAAAADFEPLEQKATKAREVPPIEEVPLPQEATTTEAPPVIEEATSVEEIPDAEEALTLEEIAKAEEKPLVQDVAEPGPLEEEITEDIHLISEEERGSPTIATPTLAEIYFEQGQLHEAITTYEAVVGRDGDDEKSRLRLDELRIMVAAKEGFEERVEEITQKKEKLAAILEAWVSGIRRMSKSSACEVRKAPE